MSFCNRVTLRSLWLALTLLSLALAGARLAHAGNSVTSAEATLPLEDILRLYRERARKNATARAQGRPLEGLAFEIDPVRYGH